MQEVKAERLARGAKEVAKTAACLAEEASEQVTKEETEWLAKEEAERLAKAEPERLPGLSPAKGGQLDRRNWSESRWGRTNG